MRTNGIVFAPMKGGSQQRDCRGLSPRSLLIASIRRKPSAPAKVDISRRIAAPVPLFLSHEGAISPKRRIFAAICGGTTLALGGAQRAVALQKRNNNIEEMKKKILAFVLVLCVAMPSLAVLKEKNLASTLSVLCAELCKAYEEQQEYMASYRQIAQTQHEQMVALMQKSDQISLMLYSQKQDFTFDMTYACHEATEMYRQFSKNRLPYDRMLERIETEITRYTALAESLEGLPPAIVSDTTLLPHDSAAVAAPPVPDGMLPDSVADGAKQKGESETFALDEQGIKERDDCLLYTGELLKGLTEMRDEIERDNDHYARVSEKLKKVNDYAVERYGSIQQSIFSNGGDNYFSLLASLPGAYKNARKDVSDKYDTEKIETSEGQQVAVKSQWRGPVVWGLTLFILFYIAIAALLSNVVVRWLVPKRFRTDEFAKKRVCIILVAAVLIFAVSVMIAKSFMQHNFFLMASSLLIEYAWLLCVIFVSLLVRLKGSQIRSAIALYLPIMLMSFVVITFRIIFIPNNLVALIFPPILLVFTVWQWVVMKRHNAKVPKYDRFYTWVSTILMIAATVMAWGGYTLMSVQILIWWMFQLSCVQTITCAYDLMTMYEGRFLSNKIARAKTKALKHSGKTTKNVAATAAAEPQRRSSMRMPGHDEYINVTWFYDFVAMALLPALAIFSVILSIWWAADVFDLSDAVIVVMVTNFVNIPDIVELSLAKLTLVSSLFFVFRYLNYLIRALYHKYRKPKAVVNGTPNFTLANNIIGICVWGMYCIVALKMLKIPATAISVISAGLATGVGFAMKDLLENFFYGISLMAGRVRVGDYIECDGIRGKVDSITYQSTQLLTADGCVIAFLNSSLFSKNFKNITKNHSYELVKVPVGVAYGSDVAAVRQMIIAAVDQLKRKNASGRERIHTKKPVTVVFDEFGDNSVNLYVMYWVLAEDKFAVGCEVKEAVYDTLNANGIEIPFPQRDVYIKTLPQTAQ